MNISEIKKFALELRKKYLNKDVPKLLAMRLRKELKIQEIPSSKELYHFIESLDDLVFMPEVEFPSTLKGFKSISFYHGGRFFILLKEHPAEKVGLFTLSHELGHYILHDKDQAFYKVDMDLGTIQENTINSQQSLVAEMEADIFAQTLLYGNSSEVPTKGIEFMISEIIDSLRIDPIIRTEPPISDTTQSEIDAYPLKHITVLDRNFLKELHLIEQFEALIKDPNTTESLLQYFFEKNQNFLLGSEYESLKAHIVLSREEAPDLIPDFLLQSTSDQLWDIIDLKRPSEIIIVGPPNRPRFSANIIKACSQLREYKSYFDDPNNRVQIKKMYGMRVFRPNIAVIIGLRDQIDATAFRNAEGDLKELRVITYDDILKKALTFTRVKYDKLR